MYNFVCYRSPWVVTNWRTCQDPERYIGVVLAIFRRFQEEAIIFRRYQETEYFKTQKISRFRRFQNSEDFKMQKTMKIYSDNFKTRIMSHKIVQKIL